MKLHQILSPSFRSILAQLQQESFTLYHPASMKGGVIFWQIDHEGYPHDGKAYRYWYDRAHEVMASPFWEGSPPIRVSGLLEQQATPAQKAAKIDLVDFLFYCLKPTPKNR